MTVALIIGVIVIFCVLTIFKRFRKEKLILFILIAVILYAVSFLFAEIGYYNAKAEMSEEKTVTGVICESPKCSDYAFTYVIKPDKENYKIRYVSQDNKMLAEGDRVKINTVVSEGTYNEDYFETTLSSRIYFTVFESDGSHIESTGETDFYYSTVGKIRMWYADVIDSYLPNENGAIAKAMTIGDKSEIRRATIEKFNYTGTSHILVISGLHLSLWVWGIIKVLEHVIKSKKILVATGFLCLMVYSVLVGFSPSIVRAGLMVSMVLLGKLFLRESDSINSVGLAVTIILLENPFSVMSVGFLFTVLSTLGILIVPDKIKHWLKSKKFGNYILNNKLLNTFASMCMVSLSTVFTLPVFVAKFEMLPITTIISNFLIVELALLLMVLTVVAVALHGFQFFGISKVLFLLIDVMGDVIRYFAKVIGEAQWSTISVSHKYFKYFLVLAVVGIIAAVLVKKYYKDITKHIAVILSIIFILLSVYTTYYDYSNPSIDIVFTDEKPIILVNSQGETVLVGTQNEENFNTIKTLMNSHNKKTLDTIVDYDENVNLSYLTTMYDEFGKVPTYFYGEAPNLLEGGIYEEINSFKVGSDVYVEIGNNSGEFVVRGKNTKILFLYNKENIFENYEEYDIIIVFGENSKDNYDFLLSLVDTEKTEIILAEENKSRKICLI